jgi:hypothetical protein
MKMVTVHRPGLVALGGLGLPLVVAAVATAGAPALGVTLPEASLDARLSSAVHAAGAQIHAYARLGVLIGGLAWLSRAERRWARRRGADRRRP